MLLGRSVKGSNKEMKSLDSERIDVIRKIVTEHVKGDDKVKNSTWRMTLKATNSKMAELKVKYGPRLF